MPKIREAQTFEELETGLPYVCVWYEGFESLIEAQMFADGLFNQIVFTPDPEPLDET